jgi:hypothetical protein
MQKVTPEWKILSLAVATLAAVVVISGLWTKRTASVSPPTTAGAAVPVEGAAISPIEIMVQRGPHVPVADPVEPF